MMFTVPSRSGNMDVDLDRLPDHCPICLQGIQPVDTNIRFVTEGLVENIFRCPRQQCERFFIARYRTYHPAAGGTKANLHDCVPFTIRTSAQSDVMKRISPDFVAVYGQAEQAEKYGLTLVCGPGYRKALEFLIKDYIIRSHPDKADEIKKLLLGKCISDYVSNDRVRQVAERAAWLGNDETHYLRKWGAKDLQDLKGLVALTMHWIEMEELTETVMKDMPNGK
jgi:hypothetical protein